MSLSWQYHPEIEARLVELVSSNPKATAQQLADALNEEFAEALKGTLLTANQVQKRRQALVKRYSGLGSLMGTVDRTGLVARSVTVTEVESTDDGAHKVSATFVRRPVIEQVQAVPAKFWTAKKLGVKRADGVAERVVLVGDFQFPYEDKDAFRLFLAFLRTYRPDRAILTGDIIDFAKISRFASDPRIADTQQELAYAHARLAEMVDAAGPDCRWQWAVGNHEVRLQRFLWNNAPELVGLKRAGESHELITVPHLVNCEALGIEWVGSQEGDLGDDYVNSRIVLCENGLDPLVVLHGWVARKGSGVSGLATSDQLDASVAVGHVHRQAITHRTKQGVVGMPRVLTAIETGTMSKLSLGYGGHKGIEDWQPGFATVETRVDGSWTPELVRINPYKKTLSWRDLRLDIQD